jgi:3-hydroxymyristoyl/3-hydroxydecanoyl-(acyl carrier protein) dehydratase
MTVVDPIVLREDVHAADAALDLVVPHDLAYFVGHFPATPVVAGVVQIKWAVELARRYLGVGGTFAGMEALKFQHVMTPGTRVTLTLQYVAARGKLHFAFQSDLARYSSGRLLLRATP